MVGEKDGLALQKLGGAVLGLGFSTERDQLEVKFRVNVYRHQGCRKVKQSNIQCDFV